MNTKPVLSFLVHAALAAGQISAQTIEVTATGVGIGTTTPAAKLDVRIASGGSGGLIAAFGSTSADRIRLYDEGSNYGATLLSSAGNPFLIAGGTPGSGAALALGANGTESMRIVNGGNVGIGSTSPGFKLQVNGDMKIRSATTGALRFSNDDSSTWALIQYDDSNGKLTLGTPAGRAYDVITTVNGDAITTASTAGLAIKGDLRIRSATTGALRFSNDDSSTWALIQYDDSTGKLTLGTPTGRAYDVITAVNGVAITTASTAGLAVAGGLSTTGNVGIGTTSPSHKLTVVGSVRASSFVGDVNSYADFVFKPGYKLASLAEVESSINAKGHLPNIPSEAEVKRDGLDVVGMQVKLLQKVEELTLYLVAHDKALQQLRTENEKLLRKISELEQR
jgi:hypothetical protein